MRAWWAPLPLLLLAPMAGAELVLRFDPLPDRVEPDTEVAPLKLHAELDCATMLGSTGPLEPALRVALAFEAPQGTTVGGPQEILFSAQGCPNADGTVRASQDFSLTASRNVPGLVPLRLEVRGETRPTMAAAEPVPANATLGFEVGFYPLLQSVLATKVIELEPGAGSQLLLELSNLGNADTVASFRASEPAPWLAVAMTASVTVPRGGSLTVPINVSAQPSSSWVNEEAAMQVVISTAAALDPDLEGRSLEANFLVRQRGGGVAGSVFSPAAPTAFVALLVAAGAMAASRRTA
jgi:hypothetical protein